MAAPTRAQRRREGSGGADQNILDRAAPVSIHYRRSPGPNPSRPSGGAVSSWMWNPARCRTLWTRRWSL